MIAAKQDIAVNYGKKAAEFDINDQQFSFTAIRPDLGNIDVSPLVESVEWRDESGEENINAMPLLRGTLTLRKPSDEQPGAKIKLADGHRIRCNMRYGTKLVRLWEMRILAPHLALPDGGWTFDMAEDLMLVGLSTGDFRYRRGKKKRKNGWRYDEIVRDICKQYRIPLGQIVKGKARIRNFTQHDISPLVAIRMLVEEERVYTGRRAVICWRWSPTRKKYALAVVPLRRNPTLYKLGNLLTQADATTDRRSGLEFATALTARGSGKVKGKAKRKKYSAKVVSVEGVKRYGYIQQEVTIPGNIDSEAELKEKAKRLLAKRLEPIRKIELDHPGIAFVRRGDAIRIALPQAGFEGTKGILIVADVTHSLSAGDYTMSLTLSYLDPMDPKTVRQERDAALRARKRKAKAKK